MSAMKSPKGSSSSGAVVSSPPASTRLMVNRTEWEWIGRSRRHNVVFEHNTLTGVQKLWLDGSEYFKSSWRYKLTGCVYLPVDDTTVEVYTNSSGARRSRGRPLPVSNGCGVWGVDAPPLHAPLPPPPSFPHRADYGALTYALAVDAKIIPPLAQAGAGASSPTAGGGGAAALASPLARGPAGGISSWSVHVGGRERVVEYVHATLDVLVDSIKVEASGSFAPEDEEGEGGGEGGASGAYYEFTIPPQMVSAVLRVDAPRGRGTVPSARLTVDGVLVPLRAPPTGTPP